MKGSIYHYPCIALPNRDFNSDQTYTPGNCCKLLIIEHCSSFVWFAFIDVDNLNCLFLWSFLIMTLYIFLPCASGRRESQERSSIWQSWICQLLSLCTSATLICHPNSFPEFGKYFPFARAIRERGPSSSNWFEELQRQSNLITVVCFRNY